MSSQGKSVPAEPIQVTSEDDLANAVSTYDAVLVDFYADWCGPCRMMEPTIESLAADTGAAVLKVDVDQFQGLAAQYSVQGIPTLLLFADGALVDRLVGAQPGDALSAKIAEYTN